MAGVKAPVSGPVVREERVSRHMRLRTVEGEPMTRCHERTLVILFPFLNAKPSILAHYCGLYHQRGHDVLVVSSGLQHFLWPSAGVAVARELLDFLAASNAQPLSVTGYHVHAFSIGAYIYTLVMMELAKGAPRYKNIQPKIQSQVFDSLVIGGFQQMIEGMVARKNPVLKAAIGGSFTSYLKLTKPYTEDVFLAAVEHFKSKPVRVPTLLFYALNDPMSKAETLQDMVFHWQNRLGLDVFVKCWDISWHAGHLRAHPEDYKKALQAFLNHVDTLQTGPKSVL
jgi:hypothetical protein